MHNSAMNDAMECDAFGRITATAVRVESDAIPGCRPFGDSTDATDRPRRIIKPSDYGMTVTFLRPGWAA